MAAPPAANPRELDPPGDPELLAAVRAVLDDHLPPASRAVVALSGGADSAALALLARRARPDLHLVAVHVRHGLRDDAADARAAAGIARLLGLRFDLRAVTVDGRGGPEAAARQARYAALGSAVSDHRAVAVLVGHSADDQAETVLLRLARGTGTRGLAGMAPARPLDPGSPGVLLLRPLLTLRRAALAAVVAAARLPTVTDPSNDDPEQRRARVRAHALPALAGIAGGARDPVPLLCRAADHARVDADALDGLAAQVLARELAHWGPGRALPLEALRPLPRALSDRVLRTLLAAPAGGLPSSAAVEAVRQLVEAGAGSTQVSGAAGGVRVSAGGGWLAAVALSAGIHLRQVPVPAAAHGGWRASSPVPLHPVPAVPVPLEELGLQLVLAAPGQAVDGRPPLQPPGGRVKWPSLLDTADVPDVMVLRAPLPGDTVCTGGRERRLAGLLGGVPRALRPLVPVLADGPSRGRVRWAAGVRRDGSLGDGPRGPDRAVAVWLEPLG